MVGKITRLLVALLCFFCPTLGAEEALLFTLQGQVSDYNDPATVYLIYQNKKNETIQDSCLVQQGSFRFQGKLDYPVLADLHLLREGNAESIAPEHSLRFYLDKGEITIHSATPYLSEAGVEGSKTHDLDLAFQRSLIPIQEKAERIQYTYNTTSPERREDKAFVDSLNAEFEQIRAAYNRAGLSFVLQHPEDMLSIYMLQSQIEHYPNDLNVEPAFEQLSEELRNSLPGKKLEATIRMYKTLHEGTAAPDFEVPDQEGNTLKLSSLRGKHVFLVFWSPSCHHCLNEMPILQTVYQLYKEKGFEIVSFALAGEDDKQEWLDTIREQQMTWLNVADLEEWDSEVLQNYKVHSVPKNYLISPEGVVVRKELYGNRLFAELKQLFAITFPTR